MNEAIFIWPSESHIDRVLVVCGEHLHCCWHSLQCSEWTWHFVYLISFQDFLIINLISMLRFYSFDIQCRCNCGHCEVMPSFNPGDCVCCREIPEVTQETDRYGSACITTTEPFEPAILHPVSLYIGWLDYTDRWRQAAKSHDDRGNE